MEELIRAIVEPIIASKSSLMIKMVPSLDDENFQEIIHRMR